jgi:hypothetical protein
MESFWEEFERPFLKKGPLKVLVLKGFLRTKAFYGIDDIIHFFVGKVWKEG